MRGTVTTGMLPLAMLLVFGGAWLASDHETASTVRPEVLDVRAQAQPSVEAGIAPAPRPIETQRFSERVARPDTEDEAPEPTVEIRIEDLAGRPAPDVPLHTLAAHGDARAWQTAVSEGEHGEAVASTGPDGVAAIPLPDGRAHLLVKGPGERWWLIESVSADQGRLVVRVDVKVKAKDPDQLVRDEILARTEILLSNRAQAQVALNAAVQRIELSIDTQRAEVRTLLRDAVIKNAQRGLQWKAITERRLGLDRLKTLNRLGITSTERLAPKAWSAAGLKRLVRVSKDAAPKAEPEPEPEPAPLPSPRCLPTHAWSEGSSATWYVWELFPPTT